jgi:hypothetical protein
MIIFEVFLLAFVALIGASREYFFISNTLKNILNSFPSKAVPNQDVESYIVNGRPAQINERPFQVSLRTSNNFHFCGGSIISNVSCSMEMYLYFYFDCFFVALRTFSRTLHCQCRTY